MMWLLLLCLAQGEVEDPVIRDELHVDFTQTVVLVNLPLKVSLDGAPYRGLRRDDIEVHENGQNVQIQSLRRVQSELTLHFLFDLSTSNADFVYPVKRAARELVRKMRPGERSKVSFFSIGYQSLTGYTHDGELLLKSVSRLAPIGSTALYDGIAASLDELSRETGTRVLIVFSDGHDLLSRTSEQALHVKVKNFGIPIMLVTLEHGQEKPLLAAQTAFMHDLIATSGGKVFFVSDPFLKDMQKSLKNLRVRYLASYPAPNPADGNPWRSLLVRIPSCPDCVLDYKRAYQLSR